MRLYFSLASHTTPNLPLLDFPVETVWGRHWSRIIKNIIPNRCQCLTIFQSSALCTLFWVLDFRHWINEEAEAPAAPCHVPVLSARDVPASHFNLLPKINIFSSYLIKISISAWYSVHKFIAWQLKWRQSFSSGRQSLPDLLNWVVIVATDGYTQLPYFNFI